MFEWPAFIIGLLLTLGTGIFVATEFALVNLDRAELEAQRKRGVIGLNLTINALKRTATHLSGAQLGITITTLISGFLLEPVVSRWFRLPFDALGWATSVAETIAVIISILLVTVLSMLVGELIPKSFALALPQATAKVVVPFQLLFTWTFSWAIRVLNGSANSALRLFGVEPKEELSGARTAEELTSLVRRSAHAGSLERDTATLLGRILRLSELDASDVMTPRPSVKALQRLESAAAVLELSRQSGHSRFPVYDENLDDVVGVVHLKQALAVPRARRAEVPISAIQSAAIRVPETVTLDLLLVELRSHGYQMAVVMDEYGGMAGVATLEDIIEELVGEVADEHDRALAGVVRRGEVITFPGMFRPDELLDRTGISVPVGDHYETVAGYILERLGRLPELGDTIDIAGGTLEVRRLDRRRVDRIMFTRSGLHEPSRDSGSPSCGAGA